ncbi:MAG: hypothetical protein HN478_22555 [Rhodospirillaceae bacterium]|nr:hypothetical protein [Rhodospirillaceae bacterium]MBT4486619.1 hypothetical protein [Rhodospirillaceae bacterium]MBT5195771.1 hypothetical protein [Rhodospirillaceae bacterium]MBT6428859.1 hypothetical protein [Rhodospirillaceae bacterium]
MRPELLSQFNFSDACFIQKAPLSIYAFRLYNCKYSAGNSPAPHGLKSCEIPTFAIIRFHSGGAPILSPGNQFFLFDRGQPYYADTLRDLDAALSNHHHVKHNRQTPKVWQVFAAFTRELDRFLAGLAPVRRVD